MQGRETQLPQGRQSNAVWYAAGEEPYYVQMRYLSAVIFLCLSLPLSATEYGVKPLGGGLYAFQYEGKQSLFLAGEDGIIATDPLSVEAASVYKRLIRLTRDKPLTHIVYSSSFFDRVPGGRELAGPDTEFVAQENCQTNLESTPHPDAVLPTLTYTDSLSLDAGGATLDLYYFGQSYGTCLSVIIAKPANIMWIHGLVEPPVAKVPADPTIASHFLHNLVPFFVYVEELAAREGVTQVVGSVVPANGELLAPTSIIRDQREFWDSLLRVVEVEYNKKTPAQVIPKKADMTSLEKFAGYDPEHVGIMMRRVYSLYRIGR